MIRRVGWTSGSKGLQPKMQELAERIFVVVCEGATFHKTARLVKRQRRLKRGAPPRFQTQAGEPSALGLPDDVVEQRARHALPKKLRMSSHGLQLAVKLIERL